MNLALNRMRSTLCLAEKYLIKSRDAAEGNHTTRETSRDESKSVWYSDLRTLAPRRRQQGIGRKLRTVHREMPPALPVRPISDLAISADRTSLQDFRFTPYRRASEMWRNPFARAADRWKRITASSAKASLQELNFAVPSKGVTPTTPQSDG